MTKPLTTAKSGQICFAFPDVCLTPAPPGPDVPVPYPNIGMLSDAGGSSNVKAGGDPVIRETDEIGGTTGDEAGTGGGVSNGNKGPAGKATFVKVESRTVEVNGEKVVCMFDQTEQNAKNATGTVLWGVPNVVVGG